MLAELSIEKYWGCSGKIAVVFLLVLFVCLLRRDCVAGGEGERGALEIVRENEHGMYSGVCSTSSPAKIRACLMFSRLCVRILSAS